MITISAAGAAANCCGIDFFSVYFLFIFIAILLQELQNMAEITHTWINTDLAASTAVADFMPFSGHCLFYCINTHTHTLRATECCINMQKL